MNSYKVYPNDPCPCGSNKKYKKCCGKSIQQVNSRQEITNLAEACVFYNINYLKGLELNKEFNKDLDKICDWMENYNKEMEPIRKAQQIESKKAIERLLSYNMTLLTAMSKIGASYD